MKNTSRILFILLFIQTSNLYSQNINQVIAKISAINELQYFDSRRGEPYENWKNYEQLKKNATTEDLIKLTENKNSVVRAYASFGLVDRKFPNISLIYKNFIDKDSLVGTADGSCTAGDEKISNELYNYYLGHLKDEEIKSDKVLFELDSITLYSKSYEDYHRYDGSGFLIYKILSDRTFPKSFNQRISFLAFEKNNDFAIDYISNWYRADYKNELAEVFMKRFMALDFESTEYFNFNEILEQLLKLHDATINKKIVETLKKDESWLVDGRQYISLFNKYAIYDFGF